MMYRCFRIPALALDQFFVGLASRIPICEVKQIINQRKHYDVIVVTDMANRTGFWLEIEELVLLCQSNRRPASDKQRDYMRSLGLERYDEADLSVSEARNIISSHLRDNGISHNYGGDDPRFGDE